jgi:putative hydrolase of the HAD superfamily
LLSMRAFLFFDVGGTLLHFRPSFAEAFGAACRDLGLEPGDGGWDAAVRDARAAVGGLPDPVDLEANRSWWHAFYAEFFRLHGASLAGAHAEALWSLHRAGEWLEPAEDTIPTLDALARAGHSMGVISNWDDTLEEILGRRRLRDYFKVVVASCDARYAKPHGEIFRAALEAAGVAPRDAIHVGDDVEADVAGARAAGIRAVLIGDARVDGIVPAPDRIATLAGLLYLPGLR